MDESVFLDNRCRIHLVLGGDGVKADSASIFIQRLQQPHIGRMELVFHAPRFVDLIYRYIQYVAAEAQTGSLAHVGAHFARTYVLLRTAGDLLLGDSSRIRSGLVDTECVSASLSALFHSSIAASTGGPLGPVQVLANRCAKKTGMRSSRLVIGINGPPCDNITNV